MEKQVEAFLHKIADGKLLQRKVYDEGTVMCDCCHAEERNGRGMPDTLPHKPWCLVIAARSFFPGFIPSPYPETTHETRTYTKEHESQFAWEVPSPNAILPQGTELTPGRQLSRDLPIIIQKD